MNKLVSITALICFLTVSAPAFAISQASSKDAKPVTNQLSTPLTRVSACLPAGSSCSKAGDCCSGVCDPKHNKCSGR